MKRKDIKIKFTATKEKPNYDFTRSIKGMYYLDLSLREYKVIEYFIDNHTMNAGKKTFALSTIANSLKLDTNKYTSNTKKVIESLIQKKFLIETESTYIINVDYIITQINKCMKEYASKALNDETKAVLLEENIKLKIDNLQLKKKYNDITEEEIIELNELLTSINEEPKEAIKEPKKEKTIEVSTKPIQPKETAKIEVKQEVKVNHSTNNKYYQEIRDDIKQRFKIESNISSLFEELDYLEKAEIEYGKDSNQYINQYKSFDLLYNQYLKDENKPVIEPKKEKTIEVSTKPIEVKESSNIIVSDDPDVIDTKEKFVKYYLPIVHRIYKGDDEATISTMDEYTIHDLDNIYIMAEQIDKIERWITRNEYSISNIA